MRDEHALHLPPKWLKLQWPDVCKFNTFSKYACSKHTAVFCCGLALPTEHYNGVIMGAMASQITSLTIVYSTVYSGADQRKHQGSASLAFVRGIQQ